MHNDKNINRYIEKIKRGTSTHIQSQADKRRHKKSSDPQTQTSIAIDTHIKTGELQTSTYRHIQMQTLKMGPARDHHTQTDTGRHRKTNTHFTYIKQGLLPHPKGLAY